MAVDEDGIYWFNGSHWFEETLDAVHQAIFFRLVDEEFRCDSSGCPYLSAPLKIGAILTIELLGDSVDLVIDDWLDDREMWWARIPLSHPDLVGEIIRTLKPLI